MHATKKSDTPTGTRRERQKAETRAVILDSARKFFETKGFEQTTIRAVAKDAGVGIGTIFSHFPDKESLLIAGLIDELDQTNRRAWANLPKNVSIKEKMLHLATENFKSWLKRPALSRVLIREMCFTTGPARDQLRAFDRNAMKRVVNLLEEAQKHGEIRADADPDLAARAAFSAYLTTVLYWLDDSDLPVVTTDGEEEDEWLFHKLEPMVEETKKFIEQLFNGIGNVPRPNM